MHRLPSLFLILAWLAVACAAEPAPSTPMPVNLLTESAPSQACMEALATGRLVPDIDTGLAISAPNGEISKVMWPFGYSAQFVEGTLVLIDNNGRAVAAVGDTIQMGGGTGVNGLFYACPGTVERVN